MEIFHDGDHRKEGICQAQEPRFVGDEEGKGIRGGEEEGRYDGS